MKKTEESGASKAPKKTKQETIITSTDLTVSDEVVDIKNEIAVMEPLQAREWTNSIDMAQTLEEKKSFAEQMIISGLLPTTLASRDMLEDEEYRDKAIGAVIAIVEYGRELGITPWVALHGMHIVQGRVVMGVHSYSGLAVKHNIIYSVVKDYSKVYKDKEKTKLADYETVIEFTRKYPGLDNRIMTHTHVKRWSDVVKAGNSTKENYVKMPSLMLRTRCLVEGLRLYCPDIFLGMMETGEMLDSNNKTYEVDENGSVINYKSVN